MSTKIYTGIKVDIKDLADLNQFKQELQNEMLPIVEDKLKYNFVEYFTELRDGFISSKKEGDFQELTNEAYNETYKEYRKFLRELNKTVREREPDMDGTFTIDLYFSKSRETFGIYMNEASFGTQDILMKHPKVTDYHYQNQCDRPSDISEEEWENRKVEWDFALNNHMAQLEIISEYEMRRIFHNLFRGIDNFVELQKEQYEKRLKNFAISMICRELFEEKFPNQETAPAYDHIKIYNEARRSDKINEYMEKYEDILPVYYELEEE